MIRPTERAVLLAAAVSAFALIVALVDDRFWVVGLAGPAVTVLAVGLDTLLAPTRHAFAVDIASPGAIYIGEPEDLVLRLALAAQAPACPCLVLCEVSALLEPPPPAAVELLPDQPVSVAFPLNAVRRGQARVEWLWLRWRGPLGLVDRIARIAVDRELPVVPNIRAVRSLAFQLTTRDAPFGARPQAQQGEGSEFVALREYVPGLDHRSIDWKHSARHRKLVCKEFQSERSQRIVLAFDTGYLMGEPLGGIPRLDHAINAALLMGYMSLRAGDQVGIFSFDAKVRHFAPPVSGVQNFARVQQAVARIDYQPQETNFTLGLTDLLGRLNRRNLVIVMTEFVDSVTADLMVQNLQRLAARHLVVFVTLQNPVLQRLVHSYPATLDDLSRAVIAEGFLRDRQVVFERLRRLGILCLDAPRERIGIDLVNRYLAIKREELV